MIKRVIGHSRFLCATTAGPTRKSMDLPIFHHISRWSPASTRAARAPPLHAYRRHGMTCGCHTWVPQSHSQARRKKSGANSAVVAESGKVNSPRCIPCQWAPQNGTYGHSTPRHRRTRQPVSPSPPHRPASSSPRPTRSHTTCQPGPPVSITSRYPAQHSVPSYLPIPPKPTNPRLRRAAQRSIPHT